MESRIPKLNDGKRNTKVKWRIAEYQSQMTDSRIPKSNDGKENTKVKWRIAKYQSQMMDSGIPKSNDGKRNTKVKWRIAEYQSQMMESMICIINTFIYWWQHNFSKMRDLGPYILSNSATFDCSACTKPRKYTVMYIYVVDVCILTQIIF